MPLLVNDEKNHFSKYLRSMNILYFKAFHIIGGVAWFAGLFYLVRILVYLRESLDKPVEEKQILHPQFALMAQRVYKIICVPSMLITWGCGVGMLILNPSYFEQGWFHIKFFLLFVLSGYQGFSKRWMKQLIAGKIPLNSFQLRLMNEAPTVLLVAIVLLAVLRDSISALYLFLGLVAFGFILFLIARAYRGVREKENAR